MEFSYEQIEKYIKGELSTTEVQSFEKELAVNTSLKEEVALYKDVEASFSSHFKFEKENATIESTLGDLGKKYASENVEHNIQNTDKIESLKAKSGKPTITRRLFPLIILAAAAALLLFIFNPFTNQITPSQLAVQNFSPYEIETFMGDDKSDKILKEGKKHYNSGVYALALENFNEYLLANPNDIEVQLTKGCAQFKLEQTDAAIQTFQQIKNSNAAKWYLALTYLKKDDVNKANTILKSLLNNQQYGNKAETLLKQL